MKEISVKKMLPSSRYYSVAADFPNPFPAPRSVPPIGCASVHKNAHDTVVRGSCSGLRDSHSLRRVYELVSRSHDFIEELRRIRKHFQERPTSTYHAAWLFKQLGEPPRLRMVYDYSHFHRREPEMTLAEDSPPPAFKPFEFW